jgi:hypothetical protein
VHLSYENELWLRELFSYQVTPGVSTDETMITGANHYLTWCQWFATSGLGCVELNSGVVSWTDVEENDYSLFEDTEENQE